MKKNQIVGNCYVVPTDQSLDPVWFKKSNPELMQS